MQIASNSEKADQESLRKFAELTQNDSYANMVYPNYLQLDV